MTEIELEGDQNEWQLPVLKLHLQREGVSAGWMRVRFPEHIDAWHQGKSLRIYRDGRSANIAATLSAEPVELPVQWQGDSKNLSYTLPLDNGMVFKTDVKVDAGCVTYRLELANNTDMDLEDVKVDCCFQSLQVPDICDKLGERLVMPVQGHFHSVRKLIPGLQEADVGDLNAHRFYGYRSGPRKSKEPLVISPSPDQPDKGIYRWTAPEDIDQSIIAIASKNNDWTIATASDNASPFWSNPDLSCMHSSPSLASCKAGETAQLTIVLHFVEGGFEALKDHFNF